ncbi:MAG: metallophosphoesterase [Candidatus Saccharicenans sp.]
MIIFITVVLLIYGLVNGYIIWRGTQAFTDFRALRTIFILFFLFLVLCFPFGRIINSRSQSPWSQGLTTIGSYYLALMIYLFFLLGLKDIISWLAKSFHLKAASARFFSSYHLATFSLILLTSLIIVYFGHLNAVNPRLKVLDLGIDKIVPGKSELRAVMISDIHLGIINRSGRLESLVQKINQLQPEVVFLAGDIVDEAVSKEEEEKMVGQLQKIKAPYGIYACPGNHEYYGGFEKNISYLRKAGVVVLLDKAVKVQDLFYVIGRKDWAAVRLGEKRLSLEGIIKRDGVDKSRPIIVLDHQPLHLEEAEKAGVDLQLSGHTHAGQLFPFNLINKLVYEKNWGYLKKGQTHIYVSSGAGTWGPAVRTGSRSEIILLCLFFKK